MGAHTEIYQIHPSFQLGYVINLSQPHGVIRL